MSRKVTALCVAAALTATLGAGAADARAASSGNWSTLYKPSTPDALFYSLSGSGAHDAWAVGTARYLDGHFRPPMIAHWNGSRWSAAAVPQVAPRAALTGLTQVKAVSTNNTWAIGYARLKGTKDDAGVIAHRVNGKWTTRVLPARSSLSKISVLSANNVWILGEIANADNTDGTPLFWHWNGTTWTSGKLGAFATGGSDDPYYETATVGSGTKSRPALLHYRGGRWVVEHGPTVDPGTGDGGDPNTYLFNDVVRRSDSNVDLSVEYFNHDEFTGYVDLYHWNGSSWKRSIRVKTGFPDGRSDPGQLCGDGAGGVWFLTVDFSKGLGLIDIRNGKIVARTTYPINDELDVLDLTLRPGTRRVWMAGGSNYNVPKKDIARIVGYVP